MKDCRKPTHSFARELEKKATYKVIIQNSNSLTLKALQRLLKSQMIRGCKMNGLDATRTNDQHPNTLKTTQNLDQKLSASYSLPNITIGSKLDIFTYIHTQTNQ